MFYATRHSDGARIKRSAEIEAFKTREEMSAWLNASYGALEPGERLDLVIGHFDDAWLRLADKTELESAAAPFELGQLSVRERPGSTAIWVEPALDVYVSVLRQPGVMDDDDHHDDDEDED